MATPRDGDSDVNGDSDEMEIDGDATVLVTPETCRRAPRT